MAELLVLSTFKKENHTKVPKAINIVQVLVEAWPQYDGTTEKELEIPPPLFP